MIHPRIIWHCLRSINFLRQVSLPTVVDDCDDDDEINIDLNTSNVHLYADTFYFYFEFVTGIFMGLSVVLLLSFIAYVGISAISGLDVSYGAFKKEGGPQAQKKQQ